MMKGVIDVEAGVLHVAAGGVAKSSGGGTAARNERDAAWLVLILAFLVMLVLLGLHYTFCPWIRLEFIVAVFHSTVFLFSSDSLRKEWHFCMWASLITFYPGDAMVPPLTLGQPNC